MKGKDPISEKIEAKQRELNEENQLVQKKKRINLFSLGTSILLFIGILITIVRTLLVVFK